MKIKAHKVNPGKAEGEAMVHEGAFSFLGDFDLVTGDCLIRTPELDGKNMTGKVLVCTTGRGSSRGPVSAYRAGKNGKNPAAIICLETEPVLVVSAIVGKVPMVDKPEKNPFEVIRTGDWVKVDADNGIVEVIKPDE